MRSSIIIISIAGTVFLHEQDARACHFSKICVEIPIAADDMPVGDFGTSETVQARGTRVRLVTPGTEGTKEYWLDDDGCFIYTSRYMWGLKLLVYPEAFLGENANVRIRGFDDIEQAFLGFEVPPDQAWPTPEGGTTQPWRVDLDFAPAHNLNDPLLVSVVHDDMADMFGWMVESFHNIDAHGGITGNLDILVHTEVLDQDAALGGYNNGSRIMLGPEARHRKFIVAHELGHWYQQKWSGLSLRTNYNYENSGDDDPTAAKDPDCDFENATNTEIVNDKHGIRSAEFAPEAMGEGYAQFIAALAFNVPVEPEGHGEGEFQYYKEIIVENQPSYADFVAGNYMVSMLGGEDETTVGGRSAWVQNKCEADWDTPLDPETLGQHVGSEIDWMRFFWGFIANPDPTIPMSGTLPDLGVVLDLFVATGTLTSDDQYGAFEAAINDPVNATIFPYAGRFDAIGITNGVKSNE